MEETYSQSQGIFFNNTGQLNQQLNSLDYVLPSQELLKNFFFFFIFTLVLQNYKIRFQSFDSHYFNICIQMPAFNFRKPVLLNLFNHLVTFSKWQECHSFTQSYHQVWETFQNTFETVSNVSSQYYNFFSHIKITLSFR